MNRRIVAFDHNAMNPSKIVHRGSAESQKDRSTNETSCRLCNERLNGMRKTAVRWLYMEWYKRAVLGQSLPSVEELTPTILAVLQVVHKWKETGKEKSECTSCKANLDSLMTQALAPLSKLKDMHSASLPRDFSVSRPSGSMYPKEWPQFTGYGQSYSKVLHADIAGTFKVEVNEANKEVEIGEQSYNDASSASTAASFFLRAAQRLSLSSKKRNRKSRRNKQRDAEPGSTNSQEQAGFLTNFSDLIMRCPPQAPPSLFKNAVRKHGEMNGKVKVMLRVSDTDVSEDSASCLKLDIKKKQAFLCDPRSTKMSPRLGKEAKLYPFDAMFDSNATKAEICSSTLVDLLHTVVDNGDDASLVVYGHPNLGKSRTLIGQDDKCDNLGVIPHAISWLYQLIEDRKERTGARFSVRVSAVEVVGKSENLKDLLVEQACGSLNNCSTSPSLYLERERTSPVQFADFTELRAPSAEKASFYFDAALSSRTEPAQKGDNTDSVEDPNERQNSHMIFTFHVYQYLVDKVGTGEIHGGRSRFHLIDLSGCKRTKRHKETGGTWLSLSNIGNVLVALLNGTKHIPHRDSKLTVLLREAFGALSSRIALIAFASGNAKKYCETLSTMEITTRIHRTRRKKSKYSSGSSGGDSSCDETRKIRRKLKPVQPMLVTQACESDTINDSEFTTSAAEDSCDTVIYVGPKGEPLSDKELTDFEGPPRSVNLNTEFYDSPDDFSDQEISVQKDSLDKGKDVCNEDNGKDNDACRDSILVEKEENLTSSVGCKQQIIETHCSCNSNNNNNSSTCIHSTEMKNIDTNYSSKSSLLASFSEGIEIPTRNSTHVRASDEPESYEISDNAREALQHSNASYYYLVPGCSRSDSPDLLNNFINRRNRRLFSSCKERTLSEKCSSQEDIDIGSSRGRTRNRDPLANSPSSRTVSLDRYFNSHEAKDKESSNQSCTSNIRNSNESIASSQRTICDFERDLVSKIVERFDVEQEITDMEPELVSRYLEREQEANAAEERRSKLLETRLNRMSIDESIIVTVTSQERLDPAYIDNLNLADTLRKQTEASLSEFMKNTTVDDKTPSLDDIRKQLHTEAIQPWEAGVRLSKDEETSERYSANNKEECNTASRLDSASSYGSLLGIQKTVGLASEGVSSGYESMRCESSGNLNTVSDMDSERGKSKSNKKDKKGKDKKNKDTPSIPESGIFNIEDQFDRSRFGKGKGHKKEVKKLIKERKSIKDSLQQILQKLVLVKDPVPEVDERLQGISLEDPQALRTLIRENRILQRKVDVCKSHLQLVTCFDANPQSIVTRTFLYKTTAV